MSSSDDQHTVKILSRRQLSEDTIVLRFERPFDFIPGQFIRVGLPDLEGSREYSIYSAVEDDAMEVLLKEIPQGDLSPSLCDCFPGDFLTVQGPFGWFRLPPENRDDIQFIFVATGTGISPFHSMTLSYPDLQYQILHGVSFSHQLYEAGDYPSEAWTSCVTRDELGAYQGRVTEYLKEMELNERQRFFFCGNSEMIFESFQLLSDRGVTEDRMQAEIYF